MPLSHIDHTIFEFVGGAWDGMNLSTLSPDPTEAELAAYVLRVTDHGVDGSGAVVPRVYGSRKQGGCRYKVVKRIAVGNEFLVRLECDGDDVDDPVAAPRAILLQFEGGCLDGRTIRSDAEDVQEALIAASYYCLTDQGAESQTLEVTSCLCGRIHGRACSNNEPAQYRVQSRFEDEWSVTVVLVPSEEQN